MSCRCNRLLAALAASLASGLIVSTTVHADEIPSRRPGLWEVKTTLSGNTRVLSVQQCIDAATDPLLQSSAGPFLASLCPARDVKKSEGAMTIDSHCRVGGKSGNAHAVIMGSFDQAYAMTVETEGGGLPTAKMTIEGKWLGPCAAGQEPGDVIMPDGAKVNIPQLQKQPPMPVDPLLPAK